MTDLRTYTLIITLLFAIGFTSCITDGESYSDLWSLNAGDQLPDFTVTMSDGKIISNDDLADKISVIVLFNTGCGDCRRELPELQKAYIETSYKAIWVAISREENEVSVAAYWADNGLTIPYSAQPDRNVYSLFANSGIPRVYISDNREIKAAFGPDESPNAQQLTAIINNIDR